MVNLTKRMHKLMPKLWRVKGGAGAAILPPKPPAPQLTSVVLRIPSPANGYDRGAHSFWTRFLPALRYHNLTIPIKVEQKLDATPDHAPTLTLYFEATTREALEKQKTEPRYTDQESFTNWTRDLHNPRRNRTMRELGSQSEMDALPASKTNSNTWVNQLRKQQEDVGIPKDCETSVGAITVKPQPAADPAAPSTTSPPVTMFQRSVTLGLRGRYALDIWRWFQGVTGARPYKLNRDERKQMAKQEQFEVAAEKDRQRVKKGVDAMKKEKEELKRAKEAAERMTTEV